MPSWKPKLTAKNIIVVVILTVIFSVSAIQLINIPRIFFDEGITIEVARNFELFGVPDIVTAPGQFSGFPYIQGSSGFPVTVPLAGFFKVFGFGFTQARIYALLWLFIFFATVWFFVKNLWNTAYATGAIALIAGFASLYDSGRRAMGDIPGLALLLLGLILLLKKDRPYLAGIFFGLAVAAKPSVYLLIIPALILSYIIADWRHSFRKLLTIGAGAAVPIIFWILFQFPQPWLLSTWRNVFAFYQNAFGSSYSPWISILQNIRSFGSQTTLIYFLLLSIPTFFAFKEQLAKKDRLTLFIFSYGIMDLLYFLKSPGTIRYLLPLELLILLMLPATISWTVKKLQPHLIFVKNISFRYIWLTTVAGLSILHLIQFLFFSSVVAQNTSHLQTLRYLEQYKTETIGILSSPQIAAFIDPTRKYHYLLETDQLIFGSNPLDLPQEKLPDVLVMPADYASNLPLSGPELKNLGLYTLVFNGKWEIYDLHPHSFAELTED